MCLFFLMIRRPPRSTRTDTLFPYTTLFRSSSRTDDLESILKTARQKNPPLSITGVLVHGGGWYMRSEEHTSELQSLMRISYAVFCLKKKNPHTTKNTLPNALTMLPPLTKH